MAKNEFLPFSISRDEKLRQSLEKASQEAANIIAITRQWTHLSDDLKTIGMALVERGNALVAIDKEQRQKSQELQSKAASITEIETLQKEIAACQARKQLLTLTESVLAKRNEETRLKIEAVVDQNLKDKQHLENVRNQIKEKNNELETKTNQLVSCTRELDEKKKSLESLDLKVRSREKKLYGMEEEKRRLKQSCEDEKVKLKRLEKDLRYKRKHQEQSQKKLNDSLDALVSATKSIHYLSKQF